MGLDFQVQINYGISVEMNGIKTIIMEPEKEKALTASN
jgi:hypothetical protein